jgi:hypothetical protein
MFFGSLIFLAISFRYPWTPHEIGWDSFFIHGLVNTLNNEGNFSSWWVHPLSPLGSTPFSYASAVPFLVSAFSQASGLSIESTAWLYGILCGIIGIFGSYLVAREVFKDDRYIFFVVIGFTTSQVFLGYTTWTLNARGFFITILPVFLFLLFRNVKSGEFNKYSILAFIFFIFLVTTHHLFTFLILPIISYFIIKKVNQFKEFEKIKNFRKIIISICGIFILIMILLILLDILPMSIISIRVRNDDTSKFDWYLETIKIYARQLGVLGLFGIFGFFYILYKPEIRINEVLLIFFVLVLLPFIFIIIYMSVFIAIFIFLLSGFGLYFFNIYFHNKNKQIAIIIIFIILLISLIFSSIYRPRYPDVEAETEYDEIYMEEENYDTGLWLKYSTNDSVIYSNNIYPLKRIAGVMGLKQFPGTPMEQVENDYISLDDYEIRLLSPTDPYFWSESFFIAEPHHKKIIWQEYRLKKENYNSNYSNNLVYKFNIKYVLEDNTVLFEEKVEDKIFFTSLNDKSYKLFLNQDYSVWYLY